MDIRLKKILKRTGILVILLFIALLGYVVYVFAAYDRLPDKLTMEVKRNGGSSHFEGREEYSTQRPYFIMTYNIGFGAYRPDFSFFMDGGKSSWGRDEESVTAAVCGAGEIISSVDPDFVLLQEVDRDGTRSYHIDELELLNQFAKGYYYTYAQNYDSPFLFFPPWEPHGANKAGLVTYSKAQITDTMRRSLPISESFSKLVDLDRCYSISRIPLKEGKMLCLYNMR